MTGFKAVLLEHPVIIWAAWFPFKHNVTQSENWTCCQNAVCLFYPTKSCRNVVDIHSLKRGDNSAALLLLMWWDVREKWEKYSQLLILLTPKLRFGPARRDGCPWQQPACLCDSRSLASKILRVTKLNASFYPQRESQLMTSSALPSLAFVWNGTQRDQW